MALLVDILVEIGANRGRSAPAGPNYWKINSIRMLVTIVKGIQRDLDRTIVVAKGFGYRPLRRTEGDPEYRIVVSASRRRATGISPVRALSTKSFSSG